MGNSYIPRADSAALDWFENFAGGIEANPSVYMLGPSDAATIRWVVDTFAAAYSIATSPATSTSVTTSAKDDARNTAERLCRQYASLIKPNAGVSEQDKIAIGVRPLNRGRSRINCPVTSPLLNILGCTPHCHTLRYRDTMSPTSSSKPFGAIALQVFVAVDDARTGSPDDAKFYGSFTRNPVGISFASNADGKVATYFARWASGRGDVGPWSLPVSMRVAA